MAISRDHSRAYGRDLQQIRSELNKHLDLEIHLLKIVEDSSSDEKGTVSANELVSLIEALDPITLRTRILALEDKGLIKNTEAGYILTGRGKERLRNKD